MERFPVYTLDSAPEASKSALGDVKARFRMSHGDITRAHPELYRHLRQSSRRRLYCTRITEM
jgi:hypothetical protein